MSKYMSTDEVIAKMKSGCRLYQYTSFKMSSGSLATSRVLHGNTITYKFEDNTHVHHGTGNSMLKNKIAHKGDASRTLGGSKTEIVLT
jgi:hypothetical protein